MIKAVRAKLHGIKVTGADLNYHGSITLDPLHCKQAGIYPLEFVYIWNKNNGQRISTYVIYGKPGSACCILNGSAARTCQVGDEVIISAVEYVQRPKDLCEIRPQVLTFNADNSVRGHIEYDVSINGDGDFDFNINSVSGNQAELG